MNLTVEQIIQRMRAGEPLRWILKSEVGRLREGCIDMREPWIGKTLIPDVLMFDVMRSGRVRCVSETAEYVDHELKDDE